MHYSSFYLVSESPKNWKKSSTCEIKASSLLTRSPNLQRPTSSPTLRHRTYQHARQHSVDSVDHAAPLEEVSGVESRSIRVRGFEMTASPSQHSLRLVYPKPLQERVCNTATNSPMPLRLTDDNIMRSASCHDLELRLKALHALYNIASGASMQSVHSCDHYVPETDTSEYDCRAPHSATFSESPDNKTSFHMPSTEIDNDGLEQASQGKIKFYTLSIHDCFYTISSFYSHYSTNYS